MAEQREVNKVVLLLLTFFLGWIGVHKFYLRRYVAGTFYMVFCGTMIPGIIAFVEFIIYACTSEDDLREKYPSVSIVAIFVSFIAGIVVFVFVVGILAAIALPAYQNYMERQRQVVLLRAVVVAEDNYYTEHKRYSDDIEEIFPAPPKATDNTIVEITDADERCFRATTRHKTLNITASVDCQGEVKILLR